MTTSRHGLRWVLIGGAGLLLLILGLLLVPFLVPIDHFRPLIVRLAEGNTGRKVEIEALRLRLLPTLHLQVVNLHVKNPEGFPSGDTLGVKSVDIGTTLGSVLARRLDVTAVSFNGVQVNLLQTVGGTTNYDSSGRLGKPAAANATGATNAPSFALGRIHSVTARDVKIASGTYDPVSRQVVPLFAIDGLNVRVGDINLSVPNWMDSVDVAGDLRGITLSSSALSKPLQIRKGNFSVKGGAAQGTFAASLDTLQGDGAVKVVNLKNPSVDFDITIPELNVDRLKTLATGATGGTPPAGPSGARRLLAKGSIKIGKVIARPIEASAVIGQITVYTDRAEINSYALAAFGGTVRGTVVVDFAAAGQPVQVTAQARGVDVGGVINALALPAQPGIAGKLDADARVATGLRQDPLVALTAVGTFALRDGTFPGLSKPLQVQKGTFNVKEGGAQGTFAASVDTLSAQGAVTVANLKNPSANFDVTVPELDVDQVRALVTSGAGGKGSAAPGGSGSTRRLLAKGAIKIGRLRARPLEATAVTGRMSVYTDTVAMDSYSLSLYGGTARGTGAVDYAAARQPTRATMQVSGVDFSRMLAALAPSGKQKITGTLEGNGLVATTLAPDPLAALTGTGSFAVRNGTIPGLDLKNTFVNMAKIAQGVPARLTKFRYFGGDFRIGQQRVYSDALKLDSEGLQTTGRGSSGFDRTLNYTGIADVKTSLLGQSQTQLGNLSLLTNAFGGTVTQSLGDYSARVPFSLKGTFDDPKFSPAGVPQVSRGSAPAKPQPQQPRQNPPQIPAIPQLPVKLPSLPIGP